MPTMRLGQIFAIACAVLLPLELRAEEDRGWERAGETNGIVVYNRPTEGSDIQQIKAIGEFDAPSWVVKNVLGDQANYTDFMPYTAISTILEEEPGHKIVYQYLDIPLLSDRDYVLRVEERSRRDADGAIIYEQTWQSTLHPQSPPPDGAIRLEDTRGSWTLVSIDGGQRTRGTYRVHTDPGGAIPTFIVNATNRRAIPSLFEAIRGRLELPQYRQTKPATPPLAK